jgi:aspartate-semialdehyde dehydrogenase
MSGFAIAIVGAGSDIGREIAAVLRERAVPIGEWRLFDDVADDDDVLDTDDEDDLIRPLADVDFEGVDAVFLCAHPDQAAEWAGRAGVAGALVIDLTQALAEAGDARLIVPEVNADAIDDGAEGGVLASPVPTAVGLSVVLKAIDEPGELKRVVVTSFEPVSQLGRRAVDELVEQTRALLSGQSPDVNVFPHRIAFNVIPQSGEFVSGGRTRGEWLIESQTRRVLELPDLPITVTSVCVPTFFGHAAAVWVETDRPFDADAALAVLREAPGILLHDEGGSGRYPTFVDVIGSDATHVGRIRDDPTVPFGLALWVAIDGLRKGAAVNAVQIAERALRARG